MKKIPSLFVRDEINRAFVTEAVTPGCEWVLAGEGRATRKWDGTACMVRDGKLYKRFDAKNGKKPPPFFEPAQEPDPITGHWPGWVPVGDEPESRWHREAFYPGIVDGTYELVGPRIGANPEGFDAHELIPHGHDGLLIEKPTFEIVRQYLSEQPIEGIVWHHPDGRMAKIKRRDFGLPWPIKP